MKFREHRGGLAESMETVVNLVGRKELVEHTHKLLWLWGVDVRDEDVKVEKYTDNGDARIGWSEVYIVTLTGYGVVGFTDGDPT